MIVTTRDGRVRVVSGWRAWLAAALVLMVFALLMGLVVLLGAAITIGIVLLIVVPIAVVLGVIASFFPSRRQP